MSVLTDNTAKLRKILEKVENLPEIPGNVAQATPSITVSSGGLITASVTQEAGVVAFGTKSATKQLTTKGGTTITPGTSEQTAVSAGTYVTGDIKVAAAPAGARVVTGTVTVSNTSTDTITINLGFVPSVFSYGANYSGGLYVTRDGKSINRFYHIGKDVAFEPTVTIQNGTIKIKLPMQNINNTYTSIYFNSSTYTWVAVE